MKNRHFIPAIFVILLLFGKGVLAAGLPVALITALEGGVFLGEGGKRQPLQAFVKLMEGDRLALDQSARIRLVFFESRRQEEWRGAGQLAIAQAGGQGSGLVEPQVRVLPEILVKQIAKTPALDSQGRAGVVRLRAIPTPDAIARLENDYKRLRLEAPNNDLNPELFLLSGLLELRQFGRIEQVLNQLPAQHPGNLEAKVLAAFYQKSMKNLRESRN